MKSFSPPLDPLFGENLELIRKIDNLILSSFQKLRPFQEFEFPPILKIKDLAPSGVFENFPHLLCFVSGCNQENALNLSNLSPADMVLTSSSCFPFYVFFANKSFDEGLALTTLGQCFRREKHFIPGERAFCFKLREFVYIGSKKGVEEFLNSSQAIIFEIFKSLNLEIKLQPANDPFFEKGNNSPEFLQRLFNTKQEVVHKNIALASINNHRTHFCQAFEIKNKGEALHSGCIGFGLDRILRVNYANCGIPPLG